MNSGSWPSEDAVAPIMAALRIILPASGALRFYGHAGRWTCAGVFAGFPRRAREDLTQIDLIAFADEHFADLKSRRVECHDRFFPCNQKAGDVDGFGKAGILGADHDHLCAGQRLGIVIGSREGNRERSPTEDPCTDDRREPKWLHG